MMEPDKDGFVCTNATGLEYNIEYYLLIGSYGRHMKQKIKKTI